MRKSVIASLFLVVVMGLPLVGCQDTKARQENDQLKAQVAELQKENADLSSKVDGLAKENSDLASENEKLKAPKKSTKKSTKGKHHKHKQTTTSSN
jgi:outer membrane murein-binding lipoprotein Lpp